MKDHKRLSVCAAEMRDEGGSLEAVMNRFGWKKKTALDMISRGRAELRSAAATRRVARHRQAAGAGA